MAAQLVTIPEVKRLSPACIRILGGNPGKFTLQGTNTYLLGTGASRFLIDTGEGRSSWISAVQRTLKHESASISDVLITHWHPDHVGGIKQLLELYPTLIVYKNQPDEGHYNINDGQVFDTEGATLTAVHTPGHTTDHMAFTFAQEDALFTGDNVLGQGTAVFENLATYLQSLEKMGTLVKGRGYPGHGPVIPEASSKISEYITHRRHREEQVVGTLGSSGDAEKSMGWTSMELVRVIYCEYPENLHLPAQRGIVQILEKLQAEGRVACENNRWKLTNNPSP